MGQLRLDQFLTKKLEPSLKSQQIPIPKIDTVKISNAEWSLLKITGNFPKWLFSKTIKKYVGISKESFKEVTKKNHKDPSPFLKKLYDAFPYRYPSGTSGIDYYITILDSSEIDSELIKKFRLQLKEKFSWDELDPKIASRVITSYVQRWLSEQNILLRRKKGELPVKIKYDGKDFPMTLDIYTEYDIRTVGYDIEKKEIIVGLKIKSSVTPLPLRELTNTAVLNHVMNTLKSFVQLTKKSRYPFVMVYSDTQPGNSAATVEEIIFGREEVAKFLSKNPEGRLQLENYFRENYGGPDLVNKIKVILVARYNPRGAKYYFTELNSNLILTTAVQKKIFGRIIDTWQEEGEIIKSYNHAIRNFKTASITHVIPVTGVPVKSRENLVVKLPNEEKVITNPIQLFKEGLIDKALPVNDVSDYEGPLEVFVFYPENARISSVKRTILYSEIQRVLYGPVKAAYGEIILDDNHIIPVTNPEDYRSYVKEMSAAKISKKNHPVLGITILPKFSDTTMDFEMRAFYNTLKSQFYDPKKPIVFQGIQEKNLISNNPNAKYIIRNVALQVGPKVGVFPYRLQSTVDYDYILGIDYSYWRYDGNVSVGGGAVLITPDGLIEEIKTFAEPSSTETIKVKTILEELLTKVLEDNPEIQNHNLTILISRDGNLPLGEQEQIKDFIKETSNLFDIRIDAVEVRKRIAVRAWATHRDSNFYTPIRVGRYQYYLVNAHRGYTLKSEDKRYYFSAPYLIGNFYRFEKGKDGPTISVGSATQRIVEMLIRLQKISYATTNIDNIKLPLPIDLAHKIVNLIRDTNFRVTGVGIKNSLFMI